MAGYRKTASSRIPCIEGTRPSIKNNQLTLSFGVPSVDVLLGGGMPVGSLVLVEEDQNNAYSPFLLKYFLAEGACCGHGLCFAGPETITEEFLLDLPGLSNSEFSASRESTQSETDTMKIAWRYETAAKVESSLESSKTVQCHNFDLSTKMFVSKASIHSINMTVGASYTELLNEIEKCLSEVQYTAESDGVELKKNVLRIGIKSIGSALWGSEQELPKFFCLLKSLIRKSYACAVVTVARQLINGTTLSRIRRHSDSVFQLESFDNESQENEALSQFHGFFRVIQLPRLHSLNCHIPECLDLAFKLKRFKLSIEKLHLPPALSDSNSNPAAGRCGQTAMKNAKLDF